MHIVKKNDIRDREDIKILVTQFYNKVRKDDEIGPIFEMVIKDWNTHINRLTDFWETNLLFVKKFKGNPIRAHNEVDNMLNHSITNIHFGIWLRLWINTIDQLYEGKLATTAKNRARTIGTTLFIKIFKNRRSKRTI